MKIILNLLAAKSGGQITRAINFIKVVENKYPEIDLIILKQKEYLEELNDISNFRILNINLIQGPLNFFHRIFWENLFLKKIIKTNNAKLFLSFSHSMPIFPIGIKSYVGISNLAPFSKLALSYEDLYYRIKFKLLSISIIGSLKRSTHIIALSQTAKKILINKGFSKNKILLSHIGVDDFWKKNCKESKKIKKNFFLYVSHFYRYKNHENLIDAYYNLSSKIKSKYNLILIGRPINKKYYRKICEKIKKLKLEKYVQIIEGLERKKLKTYYKQCDLFIFPSLVENCPNILLEAMACSCSIATTKINPMLEYCKDSALYFNGVDIENIRKCIEDFILNKSKYSYLKSSAYKRSNDFSWENFVDKLILNFKKYN